MNDGTPDLAYGSNGYQNLDLDVPGFSDEFTRQALRRGDGRLVLTGSAAVPGAPQRLQPLLAQLQSDTEVRISALSYDFAAPTPAVVVTLNLDVAGSVSADDLIVENLTTGQVFSVASNVAYSPAGVVARFDYAALPNRALPDGNYRASLAAGGLTGPNGEPTLADQALDFFVLAGDANRDRIVNIADFARLATNFNQSGGFVDGDFDYSGTVDIQDFAILAGSFNKQLPPPAARSPDIGHPRPLVPFAARPIAEPEDDRHTAFAELIEPPG